MFAELLHLVECYSARRGYQKSPAPSEANQVLRLYL